MLVQRSEGDRKRKRGLNTSSTLSKVSAKTYAPYMSKSPRLAT